MKSDFDPSILTAKQELRSAMRDRLRALSASFRAEASLVICELAAQQPAFRTGLCIALFHPLASEPEIRPLVEEAWAEGKQVVLPRMWKESISTRLDWHAVTDWEEVTAPGPFGLREPDPARCRRIDAALINCAFIPGMAFDPHGVRLGRGGGFYDRFLSQAPAQVARFGLMFSCQQTDRVPREPHDQALPAIITEEGIVSCSNPPPSATRERSIQPPPSTSSPT